VGGARCGPVAGGKVQQACVNRAPTLDANRGAAWQEVRPSSCCSHHAGRSHQQGPLASRSRCPIGQLRFSSVGCCSVLWSGGGSAGARATVGACSMPSLQRSTSMQGRPLDAPGWCGDCARIPWQCGQLLCCCSRAGGGLGVAGALAGALVHEFAKEALDSCGGVSCKETPPLAPATIPSSCGTPLLAFFIGRALDKREAGAAAQADARSSPLQQQQHLPAPRIGAQPPRSARILPACAPARRTRRTPLTRHEYSRRD
jgi:hypothetical protein